MPDVEWGSRGAEKVFADNEKIIKSVAAVGDEYKAAKREADEFGRVVTRIHKENASAVETYAKGLALAKTASDAKKISAQELAREEGRLTAEYLRQTDGNTKLTAAQRHKVEVNRLYHEQLKQEIQLMPELQSETQKLMGQYTTGGVELGNFANARKQAVGESALTELIKFGGEVLAVNEILNSMGEAAAQAAEKGRKAIAATREGGSLAVEAGGDPTKLRELRAGARETFGEGAFEKDQMGQAYKLQAALHRGGLENERAFFSQLQEAEDATQAATDVGKVRTVFGAKSAGASQLLSAGSAVARTIPGASRGDVLGAVGRAGLGMKRLGISETETFAAVENLASESGDVTGAGDQLDQLSKALAKQGYGGKGQTLAQILQQIKSRHYSERALAKKFGRGAEVVSTMLRSVDKLPGQTGDITRAESDDGVRREVEAQMGLPDTVYGRYARSNDALAEMDGEEDALHARARESYVNRGKDAIRSSTPRAFSGPINKIVDEVMPAVPDWVQDRLMGLNAKEKDQVDSGVPWRSGGGVDMNKMDDLLDEQKKQTSELKKQTTMMQRDQQQAPAPSGPRE